MIYDLGGMLLLRDRARRDRDDDLRDLADLRDYEVPGDLGTDAMYCPLCRCTKSGDVRDPNRRTEACDDGRCPCHDEP